MRTRLESYLCDACDACADTKTCQLFHAVSCCFIVAYLKMQHSCCATLLFPPTIREDKDPFMDWEEASQDKMSE